MRRATAAIGLSCFPYVGLAGFFAYLLVGGGWRHADICELQLVDHCEDRILGMLVETLVLLLAAAGLCLACWGALRRTAADWLEDALVPDRNAWRLRARRILVVALAACAPELLLLGNAFRFPAGWPLAALGVVAVVVWAFGVSALAALGDPNVIAWFDRSEPPVPERAPGHSAWLCIHCTREYMVLHRPPPGVACPQCRGPA